MVEQNCIDKLEVFGEADDAARIGFKLANSSRREWGINDCQSCAVEGCEFRAVVTISYHKPEGEVVRVEGGKDGMDYFPSHWQKTEVSGECLKESSPDKN